MHLGDPMPWFGVPFPTFKGVTEFFYAATHWKEYRDRYKELEETARTISQHKEELHELEKETLKKQVAEWQERATKVDQLLPLLPDLVVTTLDVAVALAVLLFYEDAERRELFLSTLNPSTQAFIRGVMKTLPAISLASLAYVRERSLGAVLGTTGGMAVVESPPLPLRVLADETFQGSQHSPPKNKPQ